MLGHAQSLGPGAVNLALAAGCVPVGVTENSAGMTLRMEAEMPTPVGATLAKHGAYVIALGPDTEPTEVPSGVRNAKKSAAGFWLGSVKYSHLGSPARGTCRAYTNWTDMAGASWDGGAARCEKLAARAGASVRHSTEAHAAKRKNACNTIQTRMHVGCCRA